ncbi:DNRLRE domain-containing protein [Streptomyces sp. NPDC088554]|uniref:DNRLRE domain-containing protein n=1 Tax=Streptomyces sp. NPDC088554 TaxID=3365865 RepID=UPI003816202B
MERRRFGLPASRRTAGGVAAVIAAALTFGLLHAPDSGPPDPAAGGRGAGDARTPGPAGALSEDAALEQAVAKGKQVEVDALRTPTSTTYAQPDGSFRLTVHAAPVRAEVDGKWRPIDTDLVEVDGGWAPKAAADPVVFSPGGARSPDTGKPTAAKRAVYTVGGGGSGTGTGVAAGSRTTAGFLTDTGVSGGATLRAADATDNYHDLATVSSGGHEATLSWPGELPEPVISGPSALYRNVFTDVDLLLTAKDSGFSHVLIVHNAEAAADPALATLSYGLSSPDLTFRIDPGSKVVTGEDATGQEVVISPTPHMWDSAGTPTVGAGENSPPTDGTETPGPIPSDPPDEDVPDESTDTSDGLDTAAPEPPNGSGAPDDGPDTEVPGEPAGPGDQDIPDPDESDGGNGSARRSNGSADHASYRTGTSASGTAVRPAVLSATDILALPGLAGPENGSRLATLDATLGAPAAGGVSPLRLIPDQSLLTAESATYPVFIDPTIHGKTKGWTTAYNRYPTSSFYDGANYNSGTTEARVGYESTTWGTSRSFFRLVWTTSMKGATVRSANLKLLETYAWSCSAREVQVWHTGDISSKTTWDRQPSWKTKIDTQSVAHGFNSSCPKKYVEVNAKSLLQDAADGNWKQVTIGLRASTEDSAYSWKKFQAERESAPKVDVIYNRPPKKPSSLQQSPGKGCDTTAPYQSIGKNDLTLSAASSDPDDNSTRQDLEFLRFQLWRTGHGDDKILDRKIAVTDSGKASVTLARSKLTNTHQYSWRVQAIDSMDTPSGYAPTVGPKVCRFVYDSSKPLAPDVTSTVFPEANADGTAWSKDAFGTAGSFTFAPNGESDINVFQYSFNSSSYKNHVSVEPKKSLVRTLSPPFAGPNVLYVRSVDTAGNVSDGTKYIFYVKPGDEADTFGDVTGDGTPDLYTIQDTGLLHMYPSDPSGDLHLSLEGAHRGGTVLSQEDGYADHWIGSDGKPALIAHGGDAYPGDGITDLFARMPDGKLYLYRGDGYGSVDIEQRIRLRLPAGAPDPATYQQIIVTDYNKDKRPDLFVLTTSGALWALTGYTGAVFSSAHRLAATAWLDRDLISVGDHDKDGAPDLVWRSGGSGNLYIRYGKADSADGSTLASLASAADSRTGVDTTYATGWTKSAKPIHLVYGTPDVTGDGIPDIWALTDDGGIAIHKGGKATLGAATTVISADSGWKTSKLTFG